MTSLAELVADAKRDVQTILARPCVDAEAPPGFARRVFVEAHARQIGAALSVRHHRLLDDIGHHLGPVSRAAAAEQLEPLLLLVGDCRLH